MEQRRPGEDEIVDLAALRFGYDRWLSPINPVLFMETRRDLGDSLREGILPVENLALLPQDTGEDGIDSTKLIELFDAAAPLRKACERGKDFANRILQVLLHPDSAIAYAIAYPSTQSPTPSSLRKSWSWGPPVVAARNSRVYRRGSHWSGHGRVVSVDRG